MYGTSSLLLTIALGVSAPPAEAAPAKHGLVIVVGGIGGIDLVGPARAFDLAAHRHGTGGAQLRLDARHRQAVQGLAGRDARRREGRELADELRQAILADPERPIFLIGKSGGTGLVLLAAEELPPRCLERIILLNAAVKPSYDLRPALRPRGRNGLVLFARRLVRAGLGNVAFRHDRPRSRCQCRVVRLHSTERPVGGGRANCTSEWCRSRGRRDAGEGLRRRTLGTSFPALRGKEVCPGCGRCRDPSMSVLVLPPWKSVCFASPLAAM